jgi:predicted nucleic acid-binding protein
MKIVAADTSFLFSLLGSDAFSSRAETMIEKLHSRLSLTVFNDLELVNAARLAEFMGHKPEDSAALLLRKFSIFKEERRAVYPSIHAPAAATRGIALSERHTLAEGHRTYDILLVAGALELGASHFLTFDKRQAKLAKAEGLVVPE